MITYWERFKGGPTKPSRERIHITLSDKYVILLNRNAYKLLGSPEAVALFFNKHDSMIGISPAHPQLDDAFPVRERTGYYNINASPFCRHYGIRVEKTQVFVHPDLDDEGTLRLDLKTTLGIGTRRPHNRKKRAATA